MKKRTFIFLLWVLTASIYQIIAGYSQSGVGVGLQIIDTLNPIVNLSAPINNSGNVNSNITFFFNVSDDSSIGNCTLIINNRINITDTSITKNAKISFKLDNATIGKYNWSINCTDSLNNTGGSEIRALFVSMMGNFNGSSTNLSLVDNRNITYFALENTNFGKINFSENVDLSEGYDLDNLVNLSSNKIELNATALAVLNKSSTMYIYGLTFSNPRILRDGSICTSSICTRKSYSGGTLVFNATSFTIYSSEDTPSEPSQASSSGAGGGGGGGGGGRPLPFPNRTDFKVDKTTLKVVLKQGQEKEEVLSITNIGTSSFDVKTFFHEIGRFMSSPAESELTNTLNLNEEKKVKLVFKAMHNEKPDIYTGKIRFKSPSKEEEIDTLIEVDSAEPLFDVDIEVLPKTKEIFPGEELLLDISLFNVRGFGRVDVVVEYSMKDFNGNVLATEHETLAVETQAKLTRKVLVPSDIQPGTYAVYAKVIYGNSIGTSSDLFEVKAKTIRFYPIKIKDYRNILLLGAATLVIVGLAFSSFRFISLKMKKKQPESKEEQAKQLQQEETAKKLKKEAEAIKSAFKSGFISEESYKKDKKRIEERLNNLK
ncbi:MAG: hypothetical protein AABX33_06305 [Nanoarchaeota archaeon]